MGVRAAKAMRLPISRSLTPTGSTGKRLPVHSSQKQTPAAYRSLCDEGPRGGMPSGGR